jgi:DNA-binding PadR family transcriptional regulator
MPRQSSPLSVEYVLLGFLEQESIHGYDLYKRLNSLEPVGLVWRIKQSQLYAIMERLEAEGLVTSTIIPSESHPNRKQYELTDAGRITFLTWRSSPVQHGREIRMEFLAKLYFALQSSKETTLDLVMVQLASCSTWVANIERTLNDTPETQIYERIVFQYRLAQMRAVIDWLEQVRKEVSK